MNEVEKMYENCNIKKIRYCEVEDECPFMFGHRCEDCDLKPKPEYYIYPPFTAEKQLSLMAFLINRKVGLSFKAEQGEITVEAISRGLAGIVNRIWQDLTKEERKQIKEILE